MDLVGNRIIIIIEPSGIIKQGLKTIINNSVPEVETLFFNDLSELSDYELQSQVSIIIMNCSSLGNSPERISRLIQHIPVIGLVTDTFYRDQVSVFDDLIYLTDKIEKITDIIKKNLHKHSSKKKNLDARLTSRELDVLRLLIKGCSNKQISVELFISIHTVITHRQNITAKLGIKSIAGLTLYGVINNIVNIEDYIEN